METYWKLIKTYWKLIKTYWKLIEPYWKLIGEQSIPRTVSKMN